MGAAEELVEEIELTNLVPLNSLSPESRNELISRSTIKRLPPGRHLFNQGDTDNMAVYLLAGQLALVTEGNPVITIKAGTEAASNPIADEQPRTATALARTCVTTLNIDKRLLNKLFSHNDPDIDNSDIDTESREQRIQLALEIPILSRLPAPHKQVLIRRFEEIHVYAGNVIIRQGTENKYFYLITEGRCSVTKSTRQSGPSIEFPELIKGCGFGEEALITNSIPKHTVTMLEDGRLLALSRGEFMALIVRPLVKQISYQQIIDSGQDAVTIIDMRTPIAFSKSHLNGSINLPFSLLKDTAAILDKTRTYVVCGDSLQRNTIAAFFMLKQGLDVKILNQGIRKTLLALA